jgi:hypothetical protein
VTLKLPNIPADKQIAWKDGMLTQGWHLFFDSVTRAIRGLARGATVRSTQADLATLAASLTADDEGRLVEVTDYAHVLRWSGSAWEWGPGESGSGMLQHFAVAPGTGWAACDGATVNYLKSDGTTGSVTLPNTAGSPAYLKAAAAYAAAINAATNPTISAPTFTGTPATPTGTISAIAATGSAATTIQNGAGVNVNLPSLAHTHPAPTFTGNSATPAGTISAPTATLSGDPVAYVATTLYFRQ